LARAASRHCNPKRLLRPRATAELTLEALDSFCTMHTDWAKGEYHPRSPAQEAQMRGIKPSHFAPFDERALLIGLAARADEMREHIARRIRGRVPPQVTADDLLQDVFIGAFRGIATYCPDGPDALDRWLAGIVNHKLLDALQAARAKRAACAAGVAGAGDGAPLAAGAVARRGRSHSSFAQGVSAERTPSGQFAAREAVEAVREALNRLPADYQTAVRLHHFEGQSLEQVARQMHKSKAAVGALLFRGLRELRRCLGGTARYFSERG
jgi:RNA polymerase sigma factor (sigma-70 family)